MPRGGKNKIPIVACKSYTSVDSFAGFDAANPHMSASPTGSTQDTIIANADTSKRIVVWETTVCTTPTNTATKAFVGTLAEEDSSDDIIVFIPNRLWSFKYESPYRLSPGKSLIHHHVQANTGTASLNSIQVLYTIEDA